MPAPLSPYFSGLAAHTGAAPNLQDHLQALAAQGIVHWFEYMPNSLELFVGQMLELWPPVWAIGS